MIDRVLLFKILQVAVVAPWLYRISNDKGTPAYYRTGLKLVAGTVIAMNVPPLLQAYSQYKTAYSRIIEGEATTVNVTPEVSA